MRACRIFIFSIPLSLAPDRCDTGTVQVSIPLGFTTGTPSQSSPFLRVRRIIELKTSGAATSDSPDAGDGCTSGCRELCSEYAHALNVTGHIDLIHCRRVLLDTFDVREYLDTEILPLIGRPM